MGRTTLFHWDVTMVTDMMTAAICQHKVGQKCLVASRDFIFNFFPRANGYIASLTFSLWLSQLNYKAKHESEKFKCHIPPDTPTLIQHKVNAYNLSDVSSRVLRCVDVLTTCPSFQIASWNKYFPVRDWKYHVPIHTSVNIILNLPYTLHGALLQIASHIKLKYILNSIQNTTTNVPVCLIGNVNVKPSYYTIIIFKDLKYIQNKMLFRKKSLIKCFQNKYKFI